MCTSKSRNIASLQGAGYDPKDLCWAVENSNLHGIVSIWKALIISTLYTMILAAGVQLVKGDKSCRLDGLCWFEDGG